MKRSHEPAEPVEDRLDSVIRDLYPRTSLAVLAYEATERIRELKRLARLTTKERDVLLDAANAYEVEPANFEEDRDDKRLEALRSAIRKLQVAS